MHHSHRGTQKLCLPSIKYHSITRRTFHLHLESWSCDRHLSCKFWQIILTSCNAFLHGRMQSDVNSCDVQAIKDKEQLPENPERRTTQAQTASSLMDFSEFDTFNERRQQQLSYFCKESKLLLQCVYCIFCHSQRRWLCKEWTVVQLFTIHLICLLHSCQNLLSSLCTIER